MGNFMESLVPILAIVCIFALPVLVVGYVLVKLITSNNKERMELARHGIIPPVRRKPSPNKYCSLRNGVLCIGIAIGIVLGIILSVNKGYEYYVEFLIISSSAILGLGLSYIVFYLIVKNQNLENEE